MNDPSLHTGSENQTLPPHLVFSPHAGRHARSVAPSVLLFCLVFALLMARDWHTIAARDLYVWDESTNSTVSANLTRRAFPAMLRINSLLDEQGERKFSGSWMEGPYWQHIPPLFAYIPLPLFAIDGRVTIEMKRLAYALVLLLSGIGFIVSVSRFDRSRLANASATFAAILWIMNPFTRGLISGRNFGVSDVVLAGTTILCLWAMLRYLAQSPAIRAAYPAGKVAQIAAVMALPILVKSALGLIPAAAFFTLLVWDRKKPDRTLVISCVAFLGVIAFCFAPLYFSSPETFRSGIIVPMAHTGNLEGWAKPWYFFVVSYLPVYYFPNWTRVAYDIFLFSLALLLDKRIQGRSRTILAMCAGWFVWNLIAVSSISSKSPNFMFQSLLPFLFFCIYGPVRWLELNGGFSPVIATYAEKLRANWPAGLKLATTIISVLAFAGFAFWAYRIHRERTTPYFYYTTHELFYQFAEAEQAAGANTNDLFILNSSVEDCWFRYYVLFLTGSDARTLSEMVSYDVAAKDVQAKYARIHFVLPEPDTPPEIATAMNMGVLNRYRTLSFDARELKPDYAAILKSWAAESPRNRLYPPASSCTWPPFAAKR